MALVNLVFGMGMQQTTIGSVTLDALMSENTRLTANVSAYPVEDGAEVTDNITLTNERLNLSGIISGGSVLLFGAGGRSKLMAAKDALRVLYEQRTPITIVTGMDVYTNMALSNLDIERTNEGEFITVQCEFERIRKVTVRTASIPANIVAGEKGKGAKGKAGETDAKAGKVSDKTAPQTDPNAMKESQLYTLTRGKATVPQAIGLPQ